MTPDADKRATVESYLKAQPPATRRLLRLVRRSIRTAVPHAVELISYRIPAYKLNGRVLIYFAGWTHHYALYPATPAVLEACREDLAAYQVAKGTIRFPLDEPVPVDLIARIATVRAQEAEAARRHARVQRA